MKPKGLGLSFIHGNNKIWASRRDKSLEYQKKKNLFFFFFSGFFSPSELALLEVVVSTVEVSSFTMLYSCSSSLKKG